MEKVKITNIYRDGTHYLIHIFYKDLTMKEMHVYTTERLNQVINGLYNDSRIHDYYVFVGIDFDLKEVK